MQTKLLLICALAGYVVAQRGSYAGNSRPILGSRYQNLDSTGGQAQSNFNAPSQPAISNIPIQQAVPVNNFVAPSQGGFGGNRFQPNPNQINSNGIGNGQANRNQIRPQQQDRFSSEEFGGFSGEFGGFGGGFPHHGGFGFPHGRFPNFHRR